MAITLPSRQVYEVLHKDVEMEPEQETLGGCQTSESLKRHREERLVSSDDLGTNKAIADGEPASKIFCGRGGNAGGGGGGRRKQSKPSRMCNDVLPALQPLIGEHTRDENGDAELPLDGILEATEGNNDAGQSCVVCDENFSSQVELEQHVRIVHDLRRDGSVADDYMASSEIGHRDVEEKEMFPTKYHQLGRELLHEVAVGNLTRDDSLEAINLKNTRSSESEDNGVYNRGESFNKVPKNWDQELGGKREERRSVDEEDLGLNLSCKGDSGSNPSHENSTFRGGKDGSDMGGVNGVPWDPNNKSRIFHPDAYCEICDREFCNKYFLKTHKANKHGIYDGSNGPPSTCSSLTSTPNLSEQVPSLAGFPNPGTVGASPNGMFSIVSLLQQQQQQLQQQSKDFNLSTSMSGLPFPRSSSVMQTPKSSLTTGISGIPNPSSPLAAAAMSSLGGAPGVSNDYNVSLTDSSSGLNSSKSIPADMEDYCEFCQKHFCNKYYLRKHKLDVHGVNTSSASQVDSSKRGQAPIHETTSQRSSTPMKTSGGSISTTNSLPYLRNMAQFMLLNPFFSAAAANTGASGSFPPTGLPPLLPGDLTGFSVSGTNGLSIPQRAHNLSDVKKENGSESSGSGGGETDPSGPRVPSEVLQSLGILNAEAYMEMCRRKMFEGLLQGGSNCLSATSDNKKNLFSSGGLFGFGALSNPAAGLPSVKREPLSSEKADAKEMFRNNLFSMPSFGSKLDGSGNGLASELMHLDKLNLGIMPSQGAYDKNVFGNMAAAKLVDRVVCDICNKEVCNKYFLKTHKIKVHGCDPNSLDTAGQQRTPSKDQENQQQVFNMGQRETVNDSTSYHDRICSEVISRKGYDPEAFCEICQKEFSSKYFLRTHRLNIHGIKTEHGDSTSHGDSLLGRPTSIGSLFGACAPSVDSFSSGANSHNGGSDLPVLSSASMNFLATAGLSLPVSGTAGGLFGLQSSRGCNSSPSSREGSEKSKSGRSKVICKVCDKELCNRSFLRVHLAKCHGINMPPLLDLRPEDLGANKKGSGADNCSDSNSAHSDDHYYNRNDLEDGSEMSKLDDNMSDGHGPVNLAVEHHKELSGHKVDDVGLASPNCSEKVSDAEGRSPRRYNGDYEGRLPSGAKMDSSSSNHSDLKNSAVGDRRLCSRNAMVEEHALETSPTKAAIANHIRDQQQRRRNSIFCEFCGEQFTCPNDRDEHRCNNSPGGDRQKLARCTKNQTNISELLNRSAENGDNSRSFNRNSDDEDDAVDRRCSNDDDVDCSNDDKHSREILDEYSPDGQGRFSYGGISKMRRNSTEDQEVQPNSRPIVNGVCESFSDKPARNPRINGIKRDESPCSELEGNNCEEGQHQTGEYSNNETSRGRTDQISARGRVCYAEPVSGSSKNFTMQTFRLTEVEEIKNKINRTWQPTFTPAIVCLPTLCPVTEPISVTFTLTPVSGD